MDLSSLKGRITSLDPNHCLPILKNNLLEYIDARMLQTGFNQISHVGEHYQQVEELLIAYTTLLDSYFDGFEQRDKTDLIYTFELTEHITPVEGPQTISALNIEDQSLNIRENPTANSRFLGGLPAGKSTIVIGKSLDGEWLLVPYKDTYGWINREFVHLNTPLSIIPIILNQIIPQE